ncbi:MAG TPA: hypothetical protein VF397_06305 [Pyrinomonadaceae bacterium]
MEKIPLDRWTTQEERHEIGDAYRKQFKSVIEEAQMVQGHESVRAFSFISGHDLLGLERIPCFRDYRDSLSPYDQSMEMVFVSHRWLSPSHPDPDGRHLKLLQRHVKHDAFYWIDYACMPQPPMSGEDQALFGKSLTHLPTLLFETKMLILRHHDDGYLERAWCFFETLSGNTIVKDIAHAFEDDRHAVSTMDETRGVVQQAILGGLPENLKVSNPADLAPLRALTETTRAFFELNTLMHYMRFGMQISEKAVFRFGEDPYYFFATCDFSDLLIWLFDKARELDLPISLLAQNESSDNYFFELAKRESFTHTVDPRKLPKKVTRDQGGLTWLMIRKNSPRDPSEASAHNLFFLLTSLIK